MAVSGPGEQAKAAETEDSKQHSEPDSKDAVSNSVESNGTPAKRDFLTEAIVLMKRLNVRPGAPFLSKVASGFAARAVEFGAESDLRRLQELDVRIETLGLGAMFFEFAPMMDQAMRSMFGDVSDKKRKYKTLHKAIDVLKEFQDLMGNADFLSPQSYFQANGLPLPISMIQGLRFYADVLYMRDRLFNALDANSGLEIAKFTIAGAVHRISGKYHDREVSAIIGTLQRDPDYDETAHRVWRIRTYSRLNRKVSYLPTILHAMNIVLSEPRSDATLNAAD